MFNKLVKAHTQAEIDHLKNKHFPLMNKKASKYLNTVNDIAQYPGARVEMEGYGKNFMYQHSASSSVESMNRANSAARDRTAVDVVCATKLLLSMARKRYHDKKEMV